MKHKDYHRTHARELHPKISIGIFFITLGLVLLVASNDLLNLGSFRSYFTWETVLVYIGLLLLLTLNFTGGVLFIAAGTWFLLDDIFLVTPEIIKTVYWPVVIILTGISFILSSLINRKNKNNITKA
jgi:hypothetical protein